MDDINLKNIVNTLSPVVPSLLSCLDSHQVCNFMTSLGVSGFCCGIVSAWPLKYLGQVSDQSYYFEILTTKVQVNNSSTLKTIQSNILDDYLSGAGVFVSPVL